MSYSADKDLTDAFKPRSGPDLLSQSLRASGLGNLEETADFSADSAEVAAAGLPPSAPDTQSTLLYDRKISAAAVLGTVLPVDDETGKLGIKDPPPGGLGTAAAVALAETAVGRRPTGPGHLPVTSSGSGNGGIARLPSPPVSGASITVVSGSSTTSSISSVICLQANLSGVSGGGNSIAEERPTVFLSPGQLLQHAATNVQQQQAAAAAAAAAANASLSLTMPQQQQPQQLQLQQAQGGVVPAGATGATAVPLTLTAAPSGTQQLYIPHGAHHGTVVHAVPAALTMAGQPTTFLGHIVYGNSTPTHLQRLPTAPLPTLAAATSLQTPSPSSFGVVAAAHPVTTVKSTHRRNILPATASSSSGDMQRLYALAPSASRYVAAAAAAAAANPTGNRVAAAGSSAAGSGPPSDAGSGVATAAAAAAKPVQQHTMSVGAVPAVSASGPGASAAAPAAAGTLPKLAQHSSRLGASSTGSFMRSSPALGQTVAQLGVATSSVPAIVAASAGTSRSLRVSGTSFPHPASDAAAVDQARVMTGSLNSSSSTPNCYTSSSSTDSGSTTVHSAGSLNLASVAAVSSKNAVAVSGSGTSLSSSSVACSTSAVAATLPESTVSVQSAMLAVTSVSVAQAVGLSTAVSMPATAVTAVPSAAVSSAAAASAPAPVGAILGGIGASPSPGGHAFLVSPVLATGACLPFTLAQPLQVHQQLLPTVTAAASVSTKIAPLSLSGLASRQLLPQQQSQVQLPLQQQQQLLQHRQLQQQQPPQQSVQQQQPPDEQEQQRKLAPRCHDQHQALQMHQQHAVEQPSPIGSADCKPELHKADVCADAVPSDAVSQSATTSLVVGADRGACDNSAVSESLSQPALSPAPVTACPLPLAGQTAVPELPTLPPAPRSVIDMRLYKERLRAAKRAIKLWTKSQQATSTCSVDATETIVHPSAVERESGSAAVAAAVMPESKPADVAPPIGEGVAIADVADEMPDFCWSNYLEETGSVAAPSLLFKHVEVSLKNNFSRGMKVEVPLPNSVDSYWLATVLKANGPLLYLRYEGYGEDSSADFWLDGQSGAVQYIGWCSKNKRTLHPPEALRRSTASWPEYLARVLSGAQTVPAYAVEKGAGHVLVDRIRPGMRVEVQHALQPTVAWVCQIMENVGGRLLLRYDGTESATHDFWLFFLHPRVHFVGWGRSQGYQYTPPEEIKGEHTEYTYWNDVLQNAVKEADKARLPADIYQLYQMKPKPHQFVVGWKLEAVDPSTGTAIRPATVVHVINSLYFIVQIDEWPPSASSRSGPNQPQTSPTSVRICCHSQSREIMPARWCLRHGIKLVPPKGWPKVEFRWEEYLPATGSQAAPDNVFDLDRPANGFKRGMKLEAVNPQLPHQICAATVTKVVDRLLWIHLDNSTKMMHNHIVDMDSFDIFPIGWCESNNYMLKPPRRPVPGKPSSVFTMSVLGRPLSQRRATAMAVNCDGSDDMYGLTRSTDVGKAHDDGGGGSAPAMCPKIYINHNCFSGPLLSKGRLAELPRSVGPGRMVTVLREVLTMLVSIAYKSSRVLRELQADAGENTSMHQQVLKTKYKGKVYRATVELCKEPAQLEDYCRRVCLKLECCPNLISTAPLLGLCPDGCYDLTKTKYNHQYGRKRQKKVGRPPGVLSNLENGARRGRRRRRRIALSRQAPGGSGDGLDRLSDSPPPPSNVIEPCDGAGDADRHVSVPATTQVIANTSGKWFASSKTDVTSTAAAERLFAGQGAAAPVRALLQMPYQVAHVGGSVGTFSSMMPRKRGRPPKKRTLETPLVMATSAGLPHTVMHSVPEQPTLHKVPRLIPSTASSFYHRLPLQQQQQLLLLPIRNTSAVTASPPTFVVNGDGSKLSTRLGSSSVSTGDRPPQQQQHVRPEEKVRLESNPLHWTKEQVRDFLHTTDCASLSKKLLDSDFDGQAFMLLNLPTAQEHLELKLGPAVKLCHHVERLKLAYYESYAAVTTAAATAADPFMLAPSSHLDN